jgi:NADPH-dependent glutamate synthase beta subunit-like oxidoreductase
MVVEGAVFEDADGTGEPSTDDAPDATMREKPPIFAAGDARNGSTVVVNALHDGLECAAEVADTLGL